MVYAWLNNVQRHFYPSTCLICGHGAAGQTQDLCAPCHAALPWQTAACRRCAAPLTVSDTECGQCLRRPPPFQAATSALNYRFPVDRLLQHYKFQGQLAVGRLLGELLADRLAERDEPLPAQIVPVPLHPARLAERGFNQVAELARPLVQRLGLNVAHDLCHRVRDTAHQARLAAPERRRNLRGAFEVRGPSPAHLAILDDIITTGSTVTELARVLRRAGATRIEVWSVARA